MNDSPTYASCKKELVRGLKIKLPNGEDGTFLKHKKQMSEVINANGMLDCVPTEGVIRATYGVERKTKR